MALTTYNKKHRHGVMIAGFAACLVVAVCVSIGVGASFAGAGSVSSFGFDLNNESASDSDKQASGLGSLDSAGIREDSQLSSAAKRDITKGIEAITAKEDADRIAAEAAAAAEEAARIAEAQSKKAKQQAAAPASAASPEAVNLSDVNWSVGKEAFIVEWSSRIDAYLVGSPLAGQGATFATAAWDNSIDPRWSPAISNTESTKGSVCFKPFNAWGWGASSWSNWEQAITAHVGGLAHNGYGYSISYGAAQKYCPPNADHWYNATLAEMRTI